MNNEPGYREQKRIGTVMIVATWILLLVLLTYFFDKIIDQKINPNQVLSTRYLEGDVREVTLQRNRDGHYVTNGQINGSEVVFMLDTGATGVAIPAHIARDVGLEKGPAVEMHTANGRATGYMSNLNRIGIDGIELENVRAVINPNDDSDVVLLGMTFLKEIEFTQRGNELILRQIPGQ